MVNLECAHFDRVASSARWKNGSQVGWNVRRQLGWNDRKSIRKPKYTGISQSQFVIT